MSGHSKWATTHRQKEVADQKRGAVFTRLARLITVAAKEAGADPETNFRLRLAMEKAKQANMPKENIERAIKRGTGEVTGETIEEVTYEAIGPENVAILIQCLTDNKNRTLSSIKNILTKNSGKFVSSGSISWMFEQKGVIEIPNAKDQISNTEEFQLSLIESGAEDFDETPPETFLSPDLSAAVSAKGEAKGGEPKNILTIYTDPKNLGKVKAAIENQNIKVNSAQIEYVPKKENLIEPAEGDKIEKLLNAIAEDDDVQEIYTNIK